MVGHIFISYARSDGREFAAKVDDDLQTLGFRTWRDTRSLNPHQDFTSEIEQGIIGAEKIVVCITPDIRRNDSFVRREIQYALLCNKPIIPLRFADILPPINIVNLTWVDVFKIGWAEALKELRQRLLILDEANYVLNNHPDPYSDYLKALYNQIISYLQQTVFALSRSVIELHTESSPDAVVVQYALPMTFFGQAGIDAEQNDHKQFASFPQAFEQYSGRILLLGNPGAGKTTTLLAFVREAVAKRLENSALPLPVIAPIATWKGETIVDWLFGQIPLLKRDELATLMARGEVLAVFDGLDELGGGFEDNNPRQRFLQQLPPNNQIIVSCRVKDFADIKQKAALAGAVTLQPLDDLQLQNYLKDQPSLWQALQDDEQLRELARTPLLLSLFTYAFQGIGEHAKSLRALSYTDMRYRIFETYVQRRYEHEARKRHLSFSLKSMLMILEHIAFHCTDYSGSSWALSQSIKFSEFSRNNVVAENIVDQAMLLHLLVAVDKDKFRFIHLLVGEHFLFKSAVGKLGSRSSRLRTKAQLILVSRQSSLITDSLILALKSPNDAVRKDAVIMLRGANSEHAVEALTLMLQDSNAEIRAEAAKALWLGGTKPLQALINSLEDGERLVRKQAAEALGWISDRRILKPLINHLHDKDADVRKAVVWALGRSGNAEATHALLPMLEDIDRDVREQAARALGEIGNAEAVGALITSLKKYPEISGYIMWALREIGTSEALAAVKAQGKG